MPQLPTGCQGAKTSPGATNRNAYENVTGDSFKVTSGESVVKEDPFDGFEEAIKNSEVIPIKKVSFNYKSLKQ